jgi:hypothetical protein
MIRRARDLHGDEPTESEASQLASTDAFLPAVAAWVKAGI